MQIEIHGIPAPHEVSTAKVYIASNSLPSISLQKNRKLKHPISKSKNHIYIALICRNKPEGKVLFAECLL